MGITIGMVGCDTLTLAPALREQLIHAGLFCEPRNVVGLSQLVDRASLEMPDLIAVEQPSSLSESVALIRETALVVSSHIVAIGPADDPRRIMSIMQAGANDYVDIAQWQSMLLDAVVRFRTRHLAPGPDSLARVIGIVSPSGGCGGSTVAANVATVLAREHSSAMLMDLRLEAGDLAALLDLTPKFTLADLCSNLMRLDDSLFQQILTSHSSGIQLLAAPQDFAAIERVTVKGLRRAMALGKRQFPYIVLDLGGVHTQVHQEAATQADILVVLVRLDYPSILNVRRCLEQLSAIGIERSKLRMVVNRYGLSRQLSIAQAQEALGCKLDHFLPDDPASVNSSINSGLPVVTAKPRAKISRRLIDLASSLNGRHPA